MQAYLIDTNVMLAASAIFSDFSNLADDAMPVETELRELVFQTLKEFEESSDHLVLDMEGAISEEYDRNMPFNRAMHTQEYGLLVVQKKLDHGEVDFVTIEIIEGNGERVAVLNSVLTQIVSDREDRKWVASALAHRDLHGSESPIVYGAESDWYKIERELAGHGITWKKLLPEDWYQKRLTR
jgi:hypothetical protein